MPEGLAHMKKICARGTHLLEGLQYGTHEENVCQHLLTAKRVGARDEPNFNHSMNLVSVAQSVFPICVHNGPYI